MPNQFQDLAEFLDPFLPLPINGKTYKIPSPDVTTGLRMQALVAISVKLQAGEDVTADDVANLQLDDDQEVEFTRSMLGSQFDQMMNDGLPWEYVQHAAKTVFAWLIADRDKALKVWANPGNERRPTPKDRRPKTRGSTKKASSAKTSSKKPSRPTPAAAGQSS